MARPGSFPGVPSAYGAPGLDHGEGAVKGQRIDFLSVDAARFNQLRDQWRDTAAGRKLPKIAHKIASLLPAYVSREYGYAFPTDDQLADIEKCNCSTRLIGKGMTALEKAELIERQTIVRRDEKGEAAGRIRRIYLTLPSERNTSTPEVNGTQVNGTPEVNGTNRVSERNTVFRIYPDRTTPDKRIRREEKQLGAYVPAREGEPVGFRGDPDFLDAFDKTVMEMTDGRPIGAGEINDIVQEAFDRTTDSNDLFMPFHWREVCGLRDSDTANWFRRRTGQLIHRRAA
jgi:hypothetical protein